MYWRQRCLKFTLNHLLRSCKMFFRLKNKFIIIYELTDFKIPHVKTANYGLESIRFLGPKIWESVPNDLKRKDSVSSFKTAIKKWKPEQCPCRLCKTYLQNIGYL